MWFSFFHWCILLLLSGTTRLIYADWIWSATKFKLWNLTSAGDNYSLSLPRALQCIALACKELTNISMQVVPHYCPCSLILSSLLINTSCKHPFLTLECCSSLFFYHFNWNTFRYSLNKILQRKLVSFSCIELPSKWNSSDLVLFLLILPCKEKSSPLCVLHACMSNSSFVIK